MTWGLDVPVAGGATTQVAATTQTVVNTVQQTAAPAVTTVQTTAQAPVETVQQTAAAPAQPLTGPTAAAPKVAAPVNTAPVQNKAGAPVRARTAPARQLSLKTVKSTPASRPVGSTARSLRAAAGRPAAAALRTRTARTTKPLATKPLATRSTARPSALRCGGLPLLDLLPAGTGLDALLAIACSAGDLLTAGSSGTSLATQSGAAAKPLARVLGIVAAAANAANLASADLALRKTARNLSAPEHTASPQRSTSVLGIGRTGSTIRAPHNGVGSLAAATTGSDDRGHAAPTARHGHHRAFSSPVDGTRVLIYVLIFDAALLAAILLWRVAQRRIVPRFA